MPRTTVCCRRVHTSSDEYVCSSIISALIRALWFSCALSYLVGASPVCSSVVEFGLSISVTCLTVVCILLDVLLGYASSRGLPLDPKGREYVPSLLTARAIACAVELSLGAVCVAAAVGNLSWGSAAPCPVGVDPSQSLRDAWFAAALIIVVGAGLSTLGFVCLWSCSWLFASFPGRSRGGSSRSIGLEEMENARLASANLWSRRVQLCSCAFPGLSSGMEALSTLESQVGAGKEGGVGGDAQFHTLWSVLGSGLSVITRPAVNLDLTFGDLCAGAALFHGGSRRTFAGWSPSGDLSQQSSPSAWEDHDPLNPSHVSALIEAAHYMKHTYASMGEVGLCLDYGCAMPFVVGACAIAQSLASFPAALGEAFSCSAAAANRSGGGIENVNKLLTGGGGCWGGFGLDTAHPRLPPCFCRMRNV